MLNVVSTVQPTQFLKVLLQVVKSKCLSILLYCLEVCPLTKTDLKSLDFVINRFFMKLFRTSNIDTVKTCQLQFTFDHVWGLWGCWHRTVYTVIYLCGLDHIACIHRCFAVLICEPKLLAVWLCDNQPFVFNVIKFLFKLFFFYYSIILHFVVLPFMVK